MKRFWIIGMMLFMPIAFAQDIQITGGGTGTVTLSGSSGTGDITDVYDCATGDCNSIAMTDGDLLDMDAVNVSSTTEGLLLPQTTGCTVGTAEGQVCWESGTNRLFIGDSTESVPASSFLVGGATSVTFSADHDLNMFGGPEASQNVGSIGRAMTCGNLRADVTAAPDPGSWVVTLRADNVNT